MIDLQSVLYHSYGARVSELRISRGHSVYKGKHNRPRTTMSDYYVTDYYIKEKKLSKQNRDTERAVKAGRRGGEGK